MKILLIVISMVLGAKAFSQSFLIMENGIILTTDRSGFAYDFGHYAYPQRVSLKGGQYFVEEDNILVTIDENGYLYRKYESIPQNILGKGINYFISSDGFLYSIDSQGKLKVSEAQEFKAAKNFGGTFFTTQPNESEELFDLYSVSQNGKIQKYDRGPFKKKEIVSFGGNYFMNQRGFVFTISSAGDIFQQENPSVGLIIKKGGNYFIDSSNLFYSVTDSGELKLPDLPFNLKVSSILKLGTNYFIDQAGKLYTVDRDGNITEKIMTDHDFKKVRVISL